MRQLRRNRLGARLFRPGRVARRSVRDHGRRLGARDHDFDTADAYGGGRSETWIGEWRRQKGPEVRERWQASADTFLKLLDAADLHQRVMWVAGELSARTLATTRLAETWIHAGDVATAFGVPIKQIGRAHV